MRAPVVDQTVSRSTASLLSVALAEARVPRLRALLRLACLRLRLRHRSGRRAPAVAAGDLVGLLVLDVAPRRGVAAVRVGVAAGRALVVVGARHVDGCTVATGRATTVAAGRRRGLTVAG